MAEHLRTRRDGAVFSIVIDRADAGNRLTNAMAAALADALDEAGDSRVIVIRAQGPDFCLGREMAPPAAGAGVRALDVLRDDAAPIVALYGAFGRRPQPVVGVVQGRAWGIGLVIAAVCDLTVAAEDSSFRLGELERGIPPCIAMAPLLDRLPGKALAHLVYTASEKDASWALAAGLVSELVPAAALDQCVQQWVEKVLSFAPEAVHAVKQYLVSAPRFDEGRAILYGASLLGNVLGSR